jgi:hypothetical protein
MKQIQSKYTWNYEKNFLFNHALSNATGQISVYFKCTLRIVSLWLERDEFRAISRKVYSICFDIVLGGPFAIIHRGIFSPVALMIATAELASAPRGAIGTRCQYISSTLKSRQEIGWKPIVDRRTTVKMGRISGPFRAAARHEVHNLDGQESF